MELSPEQQKAMEEQKANCIFCQIVDGKVPSKDVFKDDKLLGILDINPAAKGHVLLMPKEHYPIMPLIPPDEFKQLFIKTKDLDGAIKKSLLSNQSTIFIANGGAAGQQSAHFMLHIIPREKGDGLKFDIKGKPMSDEDRNELKQKAGGILNAMLNKNLALQGYIEPQQSQGSPEGMVGKADKTQLLQLIDANPQIKQLILENPEQFKEVIPNHPQLKQIFGDQDLDEIIKEVKKKSGPVDNSPKPLSFGKKEDSK